MKRVKYCETIFDLEREEGNIILANSCININVPGRTDEEKKIKKAETNNDSYFITKMNAMLHRSEMPTRNH